MVLDIFSPELRPALKTITYFYPLHKTDFLAEVNFIENSVLTASNVAIFPSDRGEKMQWPPLKVIINFEKNHSYFFTLLFILLDNLKLVERINLSRPPKKNHSSVSRICR
jgi:hypothetical protein